MTNWTQNHVDIDAPLTEVKKWLVQPSDGRRMFNMHMLFPDCHPNSDPAWENVSDEEGFMCRTGSTVLPDLDFDDVGTRYTTLHYETARAPNTLLLRELHKLTGRHIDCFYEDPCGDFEGTFVCKDGNLRNEEWRYQPHCDLCGQKRPQSAYRNWVNDCVCRDCERASAHSS
ncbi:MAG: hypothetical protein JNM89_01330 [Hyphomicrobiaceae bacterium]|nr:hypothetical protein [Hyphomicrobiaceae bacterium]